MTTLAAQPVRLCTTLTSPISARRMGFSATTKSTYSKRSLISPCVRFHTPRHYGKKTSGRVIKCAVPQGGSSGGKSSPQASASLAAARDLGERFSDIPKWERLALLRRQLEVAIAEENFETAARLRDQAREVSDSISPEGQLMSKKLEDLWSEDPATSLSATETLCRFGDARCFPHLIEALNSKNMRVVALADKCMWGIFSRGKSDEVEQLFQEGLAVLLQKDQLPRAEQIFDKLIALDPSFTEGYNKRATVRYLRKDYMRSIEDCKEVVRQNPYHFGALSGMALNYLGLHQLEESVEWFERALAINPNLGSVRKYVEAIKKALADKNPFG
eukprot:jgi/Mesvir1/17604/Mv08834-RA.1